MGIPDNSLLDLIEKVRSWISWGNSTSSSKSRGFEMADNNSDMCCRCEVKLLSSCLKYHCQSCGRLLCGKCVQGLASMDVIAPSRLRETMEAVCSIKTCRLCVELGPVSKAAQRCSGKIFPSDSPTQSPEPPSPSFSGERSDGQSPHALTRNCDGSFSDQPSPLSDHRSPSRSDEDDGEDSTSHFFSAASEYFRDTSDVDSNSGRHEFYSFTSVGSSPSDSPSRIHITSNRVGRGVQQRHGGIVRSQNDGPFDKEQAVLEKAAKGIWDPEKIDDLPIFDNKGEKLPQPLDFETNGLIWFPPPPYDVTDEVENNFFTYDDEDDEVGDSGETFSPTADLDSVFLVKEKQQVDHKESFRAVVKGHFRALVSQLLQGQGIISTDDDCADNWLNIITAVAWQAANFIKPDTSGGGSMDPSDYLKVKCVAAGSPSESKLIKGVVCTKNIKHKRMTSQYKNTRLLLLGGALEYQRVPNQLASFNTLLQQENDHLKMIVSKIEAHRPNVLLVEKSVSSFAQDQLLAKDISLVLNVKRPLLERIARCTGAIITPSTDHISTTQVGHCELFHLEKISEDHEPVNQFNRRPSKTLMFFEGCPRRLGCTVVLRGSSREDLKKVKAVTQYAVFAAYHLSLETSFLADEGASLPKKGAKSSQFTAMKMTLDKAISIIPDSAMTTSYGEEGDAPLINTLSAELNLELGLQESLSALGEVDDVSMPDEFKYRRALSEACDENLALDLMLSDVRRTCPSIRTHTRMASLGQVEGQSGEVSELAAAERADGAEASSDYYSANDNNQSILVSFSSHSILNGTACERSRLLRVKFYGPSDKPLGRFLRDDLFDKSSRCRSCKESAEAHSICYTHQHGNLTINVRSLTSVRLPGEQDGKIWMWHRCLRCSPIEGVPPATRRVVMSDAAWGLSFGKFLELSFSNHATGNRVASCGHSLQRDCLRFYGFGSMVAFFRYSPINILSVRLPPSILEFGSPKEQSWIRKEASELLSKAEALYAEISAVLQEINERSLSFLHEFTDANDLHGHILELNDMLANEKSYYKDSLQLADEEILEQEAGVDILEINRLRHSLLIGSHVWDRRLYLLDSLLKRSSSPKALPDVEALRLKDSATYYKDFSLDLGRDYEITEPEYSILEECLGSNDEEPKPEPDMQENDLPAFLQKEGDGVRKYEENAVNTTSLERLPSAASILSDKIDSAWCGAGLALMNPQLPDTLSADLSEAISVMQMNQKDNPSFRRLLSPTRVHSFDSAQTLQERMTQVRPPSLHLSTLRSFHASGDYKYMLRDPVSKVQRTYSQVLPREAEKLNLTSNAFLSFISSISLLPEGARSMVQQNSQYDIVVAVYDNEPTSIISYALTSKEYVDWIADKPNGPERGSNASLIKKMNSVASDLSTWRSFGSLDLDYQYGNYGSEDAFATVGSLIADPKNSPHHRMSFEDESSPTLGKVKFTVTCYFAKEFDALRKKCCPGEVNFVRSLSRCKRWSAQGGKSNVYFAKSFDERFIIKQVTKTELESFDEFAPEYFKYLTDALSSGSPTCLAKVLGIYQVSVKHARTAKETKMDLMVMENLFFERSISKVYDLKGSARSRYNSDTTGANKVLLDMNLLETLHTNPIFLGSKAKRRLERAVWNDTSFLASVDVMDYSLLVGVDEERKELVLGIIDYMRQYTWDKHLETWVKASGILGGPKNASPTIVSPKQYKKRFRKAMTTYFLTVPDQWSS
ncbi:putative 1-phosphatidylinositol-3-phosphate 5-kinase FAB1C [Sesamum alatum]|uniref:1-phosphatidylinositol-3-phosphate 5-kinase n=1 Tax=Sesamum alatum TaxID=300844 RepID=A0AAE1Y4T1_9LAMI|nr:putative 1-phosphatidylinositol-3-phosphate 5-kinase FAB1C [Sesamum alatum]